MNSKSKTSIIILVLVCAFTALYVKMNLPSNSKNNSRKQELHDTIKHNIEILKKIFFIQNSNGDDILKSLKDSENNDLIDFILNNKYNELEQHIARSRKSVNTLNAALGFSPFEIAALRGNLAITELLLKFGADINQINPTTKVSIWAFVQHLTPEIQKLMLKNGADPNVIAFYGKNILAEAIYNDNYELAQQLILYHADVNVIDKNPNIGWTPIYYSIEKPDTKFLELLIANGADVDFLTMKGITPLQYALARRNAQAVTLLLQAGAAPNNHAISEESYLVRELSNAKPQIEIVEQLLKYGANPNRPDKNGNTPILIVLHNADKFGKDLLQTVKCLVNANCSLESVRPIITIAIQAREKHEEATEAGMGNYSYLPLEIITYLNDQIVKSEKDTTL